MGDCCGIRGQNLNTSTWALRMLHGRLPLQIQIQRGLIDATDATDTNTESQVGDISGVLTAGSVLMAGMYYQILSCLSPGKCLSKNGSDKCNVCICDIE